MLNKNCLSMQHPFALDLLNLYGPKRINNDFMQIMYLNLQNHNKTLWILHELTNFDTKRLKNSFYHKKALLVR
ncbi:unnamed protein product [Blepharisma stoltei]|uniref:Maturase K n=1 Tax=Blepharisma stoltei TaxID=1481888 RepID=A0AAU9IF90_9CILI|nr:unnamed protein product [Blepharisma stoltei]